MADASEVGDFRFEALEVTTEDLRECSSILPSPMEAFFPVTGSRFVRVTALEDLENVPLGVRGLPPAYVALRMIYPPVSMDPARLALIGKLHIFGCQEEISEEGADNLAALLEKMIHLREVLFECGHFSNSGKMFKALGCIPGPFALTFKRGCLNLQILDQQAGPHAQVQEIRAVSAASGSSWSQSRKCGVAQRASVLELPCSVAISCLTREAATKHLILYVESLPDLEHALCTQGESLPQSLETMTLVGNLMTMRCAELYLKHEDLSLPETLEVIRCGNNRWVRDPDGHWRQNVSPKEEAVEEESKEEALEYETISLIRDNMRNLARRMDREEVSEFIRSFNESHQDAPRSYRKFMLKCFLSEMAYLVSASHLPITHFYDMLGFMPRE